MTEPKSRDELTKTVQTVKVGIVCGFVACLAYPLAAFAHPLRLATVTLVALFGPHWLRRATGYGDCSIAKSRGFLAGWE